MRLGWGHDDVHFSSRARDAAQHECRCPFYFAWGCFRDFVSKPRDALPHSASKTRVNALMGVSKPRVNALMGAMPCPGYAIVSASRLRPIDSIPSHHGRVAGLGTS